MDHRRKGLAYLCGVKLILECLRKGLYSNWDAQNEWPVVLIEKLGYLHRAENVSMQANCFK